MVSAMPGTFASACGRHLALVALSAAAVIGPMSATACTAIIVGKKASATGRVIVAHNNDGSQRNVMRYAMLPRRSHAPGETMVQEANLAKIPEAPVSAACYWSEVKSPSGAPPPGDHFLNEFGVLVVSNNGGVVREWHGEEYSLPDEGRYSEVVDGGLGHNFRRAVIERSHTASEAIAVATNLLETWGYAMPSRIFTIADKDEAWVLEVLKGRRYVARRCPDDAVVMHPNCLSIGALQEGDVVSPCFAAKGPGFDFIASYQGPRTWKSSYNVYRWREAYRRLAGVEIGDCGEYPFSVVPVRKVGWGEIRAALSSHLEGTSHEQASQHPIDAQDNAVSICRRGTMQSMACLFAEDPADTEVYVAKGRPCTAQFQKCRPFRGEMPEGAVSGDEAIARLKVHSLPLRQSAVP